MTPQQRQRSEQLFLDAVELPPADRRGFVQAQCEDDPQVRNEVESLLAHDNQAPFLDSGALGVRATDVLTAIHVEDDAAPQQIAGYRILRQIGRGGTATVYEAEQANPRRIVAIKVVHGGPGTRGLRRRFEREIEVLGQLRHPAIAQIYDAGFTGAEAGATPFYAMELVRGPMLTDFVAQRRLPVRERLALVAEICDAVQYAHELGIIHRDLKPANILVDESSATPRVKVLDFGVARVLESPTQLTIDQTHVAQIIGTIPYMSPEQVRGRTTELDARTDVYSLGVILYELLGERLPLDVRERSMAEAARIIQEDEPTRLSSIKTVFRGDIETIVAKALEKDRSRRYLSVADLAADLRRYLRNEPIRARPASSFYQLRKFAQRNRGLMASLTLLMVGLAGATAVSTHYAFSAARERTVAEQRAHRADTVAANAEMAAGDPARAWAFLDQDSPSDRGSWEWRYLAGRLDTADKVFRGHTAAVGSIAFAPRGDRIASGSDDGSVRVWSVDSGTELLRLDGHAGPVTRVAFGAGGSWIVSGGRDGALRLWNSTTGRLEDSLPCGGSIVDLGLSQDGLEAVALIDPRGVFGNELSRSRILQVWNLQTHALEWDWPIARAIQSHSCSVSADGTEVLLGTFTGIQRRDRSTGELIDRSFGAHDYTPLQIAVGPCGVHMATCAADKQVVLWDPQTLGIRQSLMGHLGPVRSVALSSDGMMVASGSDDRTVRLWNADTGDAIRTLLGCGGSIDSVAFSPDGSWLAAAAEDATIHLWNLPRLKSGQADGILRGHTGAVYEVAAIPGRDEFVSGSWNDHTLRIWNARTGEPGRVLTGFHGQLQRIVCSRDGRWIAVGGFGVELIDLNDGSTRRVGQIGERVRSIVFSHDGRQIITTARHRQSGFVQTWDIAEARQVARQDYDHDVLAADSPAGIRLAVQGDGEVSIFDYQTGHELFQIENPHGFIERMRFAPDGRCFLTAFDDGTVGVWDARDGHSIALLRGHTDKVYDALYSPDGTRIATASNDNTIRIWRADTFEEVLVLRGHSRYVYGLAFSSDGTTLASASGDHTVRLWHAPPLAAP